MASLLFAGLALAAEVSPTCGAAGDLVLVRGDGFPGAPSISFDGITAEVVKSDATRILCRVPAGTSAGAIDLVVETETLSFSVLAEGSPVVLYQSSEALVAGQPLLFVGRRLGGGEAEFFDGDGASAGTASLHGRERAAVLTVPQTLAVGTYTVVITNEAGLDTGACSPTIEVVVAGDAALDSIAPEGALAGHRIEISGSDLSPIGPCRVIWTPAEGDAISAFGFSDGYGSVFSLVPFRAEAGATYDVSVELRGGAVTNVLSYEVGIPEDPVLDSIDPDSGRPGSVVKIHGSNLLVAGAFPKVSLLSEGDPIHLRLLFAMPGTHGGSDLLVAFVPFHAPAGDYDLLVTVGPTDSNPLPFTLTVNLSSSHK